MGRTLEYTERLTVTTCWCGMAHAIPTTLYDFVHRKHDQENEEHFVYCPLGHKWTPAGKSKLDIERERVARQQELLDNERAARRAAEDQLTAATRENKRVAQRVANGVCPCCKRSFVQLAKHMANKHPEFTP